jgi:hypothetical protein
LCWQCISHRIDDEQVLLHPINAGNEPNMRSLNSNFPTNVSFVNLRNTPIHLWWLNFEGKRVSYGTVQPYGRQEMNTYETHPWVIVAEGSNQALGIWLPVAEKGLLLVF